MPVTHLLAFDVEASGPSVTLHWCPEFGAALVEIESGVEVWRFHTYCAQPLGRSWCPTTLAEFWLSAKMMPRYNAILAAMPHAPSPQDAMRLFVAAVRLAVAKHVPGGAKAVQVICDTTGFDAAFMESMMSVDGGATSLRTLCDEGENRPLRDVHSVYVGVAGCLTSDELPKNPESGKRYRPLEAACLATGVSMPVTSCKHTHDPADDASHMAQCAAHVMRALRLRLKAARMAL